MGGDRAGDATDGPSAVETDDATGLEPPAGPDWLTPVGRPDLSALDPAVVAELLRTERPLSYFASDLEQRRWEQLAARLTISRDYGMSQSHCDDIRRRMALLVEVVPADELYASLHRSAPAATP